MIYLKEFALFWMPIFHVRLETEHARAFVGAQATRERPLPSVLPVMTTKVAFESKYPWTKRAPVTRVRILITDLR